MLLSHWCQGQICANWKSVENLSTKADSSTDTKRDRFFPFFSGGKFFSWERLKKNYCNKRGIGAIFFFLIYLRVKFFFFFGRGDQTKKIQKAKYK